MPVAHIDEEQMDGVWTAIVTPFTNDGTIDLRAFDALIDDQKTSGIRGLVVVGSTGEGSSLSKDEKTSLIKHAVDRAKPQLEVMAGTGTINTTDTLTMAKIAIDNGVDSLLIVTPPYCKPSTAGLVKHFAAIAQISSIPICLYHVPGRTGQKLTIDQFKALTPFVSAIKEAGAEMDFYTEVVLATASCLLSGDDLSFLPSLSAGGRGCISVLANIVPQSVQKVYDLYQQGDNAKATAYHHCLFPLMQALFWESNPGPVKAILAERYQQMENVMRLPLAPMSEMNNLLQLYQKTKARLECLNQ